MQSIAIAVKAKLKKSDFDLTVGIHPSAAEEFVTMRYKEINQTEAFISLIYDKTLFKKLI